MGFYFDLGITVIRYLSYIYDLQKNNRVNCTATSLQIMFRVKPNDLAKQLTPAFKNKYLKCCGMYFKLTKEGEEYVQNYRHREADDRNDKKQS